MAKDEQRKAQDPGQPRLEDFMTVEDLAKELGVARKVVLGWRDRGMPHVRVDARRTLVYTPALAAWLLSKQAGGSDAGD